ncbi:MAG: hypothetical protein ACRDOM_10440 [Nocardioides sp.]
MLARGLAALLLLLLQGCITVEGDGEGGNGRNGSSRGQGAPISNGGDGGNGGEAPGAPIDIPAITIAENQPADVVRAQLEQKLREAPACGGEVCLDIEVAETDADHETCQYSGDTDPPAGTEVESGSTVTLVMGSKPCTDANGDGVSDDNNGDGLPDDTDGDGTPDVLDDDADGDGIPDTEQSPS